MSSNYEPQFVQDVVIDPTPMPEHVPKVKEIGSTSAPLFSAAYFIGARCKPYGDDFMQCKTEAYGKGEIECMREGRKVTRCAQSVLQDLNTHCLHEWRTHWKCLERNNHLLHECRPEERPFNACVKQKIGLEKSIPDYKEGEVQVHERIKQIFATFPEQDENHLRWLRKPFNTMILKWQGLTPEEAKQRREDYWANRAVRERQEKERAKAAKASS